MTTEQPNDRRSRKRVKANYTIPSSPGAQPRVKAKDKDVILPEPVKPEPAKKTTAKKPAPKTASDE